MQQNGAGTLDIAQQQNYDVIEEEDQVSANVDRGFPSAQFEVDDGYSQSVAVIEKNEVCSPGFVIRRQKEAIDSFTWDPNYASDIIEICAMNRSLFLKEEQYLFRTVIANKSFTDGIHYWEIVADARTENELKIGVVKNRDFDLKTAFCDYSFGWAFYCNGQLRHCDGANG